MKKSRTLYAEIDNKKHSISYDNSLVYYKYRWRHIQSDGAGGTFIEYPGATVFFEIKQYTPEETKELIDLYGE